MNRPRLHRLGLRGRPSRKAWIVLLTTAFAALVVLPEAVSAEGLTRPQPVSTVPADLSHGRAIVLRPNRIDLVRDGRVLTSMPFNGAAATLAGVAAVVDGSYVTRIGDTVTLKAAVLQRPGTSLTAGADGIRTLRIVSRPGSAAYLWGTGANLTLTGVAVRADPAPAAIRPYLLYSGGSHVTVRNGSLLRLGRSPRGAALEIGTGSGVTVTDTTFTSSSTGLSAHASASVVLRDVTVSGSAGDGITLRNAGAVDVVGIDAVRNGRNGITLSGRGTHVRALRDVTATGNKHAGLMVVDGTGATASGLRTTRNGNAGAALTGAGVVQLSGVTSTSEPTGIRVHDGQPVTISGLTAISDATGVSADGKGHGLVLQQSVIHDAQVGVRIQTPGARVSGVRVLDSDAGLDSDVGARGLVVTALEATSTAAGVGTGLVAGGAVTRLSDVHVAGFRTGLRIEEAGTTVKDSIAGAAVSGVLLDGAATGTTITGISTYGAKDGLRVAGAPGPTRVEDSILGGETGLRVGTGDVTVVHSTINGAQDGVRMAAAGGTLTLDSADVTGTARTGLALDAGTTSVVGSAVHAGRTAIDAGAPVGVDGSSITGAVGIHVAQGVTATVDATQVHAEQVGVLAVDGAHVTLTASQIHGVVPVRGSVTLRGPSFIAAMPLNWLGVAGISLVLVAVLLMIAARLREGDDRVALAPAHVVNRA
ncbi:MAG TPA: right-handed parallel beta-helix repeat-containing protein [Kineosporiaceae bacterium]|nr:right-handed parallel beta-helix repeat-containing protein [Kineosporiaceae bacterium]